MTELGTETRRTVMVVDDSEDIRELVRFQLTALGYRVVEAADGLAAVDIARRECPALILMDITMPVMDGLSATRLLREITEMCNTVIVAFSALDSDGSRKRAMAAGCDDYLNKPVNLDQLSSLLDRHLPAD